MKPELIEANDILCARDPFYLFSRENLFDRTLCNSVSIISNCMKQLRSVGFCDDSIALARRQNGAGCPCVCERLSRDIYARDSIERGVAAREPVGQRFCVHLQLTGLSADCARRNRRTRVLRYLPRLPVARLFSDILEFNSNSLTNNHIHKIYVGPK